jgi:hypothetical protein
MQTIIWQPGTVGITRVEWPDVVVSSEGSRCWCRSCVSCGLLELGPAAIPKRLSRTPSSAHQHRNTITAHTPHDTTHPPHRPPTTDRELFNYTSTQPTTAIMAQEDAAKRIEEAKKLSKDSPAKAEAIYKEILSQRVRDCASGVGRALQRSQEDTRLGEPDTADEGGAHNVHKG